MKFDKNAWVILNPIEQSIKTKIEAKGTPLKDWDISIYRGILTGCNEAFIISDEKRKELIKQDPKSAEIIRPILRGRDIKRYGYEFADLYLIATFPSRRYNIDNFPVVKNYLENFGKDDQNYLKEYGKHCWGKKRLGQTGERGARKKTNNKWFETQDSISYWDDFFRPKIVYPETTQKAYFAFDDTGIFIDKTCFMLISKSAKSLQAILSSKLYEYAYKRIFSSIELGETAYQYNKHALVNLPVKQLSIQEEKTLDTLVDKIVKAEPKTIAALETQIDNIVCKFYNLTEEEKSYIARES